MAERRSGRGREQLQRQIRQLILLRETGPKRVAWHNARVQLLWRLHRRLELAAGGDEEGQVPNEMAAPQD